MSQRATKPIPSEVERRAAALARRHPTLIGWPEFFVRAAAVQAGLAGPIEPLELPAQYLRDKRNAGKPALADEDLPFDTELLQTTLLALCDCAMPAAGKRGLRRLLPTSAPQAGELATRAKKICDAVQVGAPSAAELSAALLTGGPQSVTALANTSHIDPALTLLLTQMTLQPWFWAWSGQTSENFDEWPAGHCPTCGSLPVFSEISGKEGLRQLRCAQCGASWPHARLSCRHCGNAEHARLGRLHLEGEEEKYFVQTCDACKGYDKFINSADPLPRDLLLLEDMMCVDYDEIARVRGFTRAPEVAKVQ